MPTLISKVTTQEFSMDEIKKLICQDLDLKPSAVKIEAIQTPIPDPFDRGPTRYNVTGIRVTVDNLAS